MRLRLGLLQDPQQIEAQIAREAAEAETARQKVRSKIPTVKTEEQTRAEETLKQEEKKKLAEKAKKRPRIRPLSEGKAIDMGANFISEGFLFLVAGGLIVLESWRRDRKERGREAEVLERLGRLEVENKGLKEEEGRRLRELEELRGVVVVSRGTDGAVGQALNLHPVEGKSAVEIENTTGANKAKEEKTVQA